MKLNESYKVYKILSELREHVGSSEFGYRVQGLFAHTLIYLGIRILEIKPQGHPDIIGMKENNLIKFEVESILGNLRKRVVDGEDIKAIKPYNKNEKGYIATLYCNFPPEWLLVDYNRLKWRILEQIPMITIKSLSNKKFSSECTEYFYKLILSKESRLFRLTFHLLRDKALKGEKL